MNWTAPKDTAFLAVDMTYDFLPPNGALMVEKGDELIPLINDLLPHFEKKIWTKEEHAPNHAFFASSRQNAKPLDLVKTEFGDQFLWPDHCIKDSKGAKFPPELGVSEKDMIIVKGTDPSIHAYSAFYMDDRKTVIRYEDGKTLTEKLTEERIKTLVVCGLAYDFCAGLTAYDAAKEGFRVIFLRDLSHAINIPLENGKSTVDIMDEMLKEANITVTTSSVLKDTLFKNQNLGVNSEPETVPS